MSEINNLQTSIMLYVKQWANTQKTPIPQKAIISTMETKGIKYFTTKKSISILINKGYLRRAYSEKKNVSKYVMIRNISI